MTTISLTEEENIKLENTQFIDLNKTWKYMTPFYYKIKDGYYEIYTKEEYKESTNNFKLN